jgi:hypothetical protein
MTSRWKPRLLAATVVFLTVLPILIFATNATQRGPLVTARNAAIKRAGAIQVPDSLRRERRRLQRQRIRPTPMTAAFGVTVQLFWVAAIGIVGRKFFQLRL